MMRLILLLTAFLTCCWPEAAGARSFYVDGANGSPLGVFDEGPADGPEILFIHGLGQGAASFRPQFESPLARDHHLVAFDLRGHGVSGKPTDAGAYTDPGNWAEDVDRVMAATHLHRPVIVAWSYGTRVVSDYIRVLGSSKMGGLVLVGALGGMVAAPPPTGSLPPNLVEARRLQSSLVMADRLEASRLGAGLLTAHPVPGWTDTAIMLGLLVPPYAQAPLRKHPVNNVDIVDKIGVPVLVIYGQYDPGVSDSDVSRFLKQLPTSKAIKYEASGHATFAEEPERFNRDLASFVDQRQDRSRPKQPSGR